jgi:hypothetical protein
MVQTANHIGINYQQEIDTIVKDIHDHIREYDWAKFVIDVHNDQYALDEPKIYYAHKIYLSIYMCYLHNIEFNERVFNDVNPLIISYFEAMEEYEKCGELKNLTYDDVSDFVIPSHILKG